MKRIIFVVLTILLLVSSFTGAAIAANASGNPTLSFNSAQVAAGETVTLQLSVEDNVGIAGLAVSLKYNTSILTLTKTTRGSLFSGFTAGRNFVWDESKDVCEDGVLATFVFTVAEGAAAGEYPVEIVVRSCTNEALDDIVCNVSSGIVKVGAEEEPIDPPILTLKYPTVSFEDEIIMNIFFSAENLGNITPDKMGLITFNSNVADGTIENADAVIPGAELNAAAGFYCANTKGIAAKNLGDKVYFRAYAQMADGTYAYSNMASYSPMKYAYSVLNGNYGNDMKALVAAMLNYGAAAQVYFNHNTDALVNADMTAAHKALVEAYNSSMIAPVVKADSAKAVNFVNNGGFSRRYPSISFESAFSINYFFAPAYSVDGNITLYYWTTADYNSADVLTTANATGSVVATAGSEYEAAVKGIAAKDLDGTIYVAAVYTSNGTIYGSGVLAYSIGAYCLDRITNGSATMQGFASATAVYGYYAKAYFAK